MERGKETGFKDKTDRSIHVDDVVQYRLGKFGKGSGGPRNSRVIEFHGKYQIVAESTTDVRYGGLTLDDSVCEYLIVFRCNHLPT